MSKKLVIMRGVPGSGKSTVAKEMATKCIGAGKTAVIASADDYFIDSLTGSYIFDAKKLPSAHLYCKAKALGAMEAKADMVIIDNTNMRHWDFDPYVKMAKQYRYEVEEVIVGSFDKQSLETYVARNVHGCPKDTIEKMAARFEK